VRRAWHAWVMLMDRRESPAALALVRIACAAVLLCDQLWVRHVGLVEPLWSPPPGGFAVAQAALGANGLSVAAVAALACVALGLFTRLACVAFVLVSAQMAGIAPDSESALDVVMRVVFLVLALSGSNARWSLDALIRRRVGRPMPELVPAWPRYLLLLQLLWMYFSSGINKTSASWGPHGGFTALANALMDPHNGRLDPGLVAAVYPLTRVATALTMVFELLAPLYLVALRLGAHRWRWIWIAFGICFQLGIAIGLRLGAFPFGMLALFPTLLVASELQFLVGHRPRDAWPGGVRPSGHALDDSDHSGSGARGADGCAIGGAGR